MSPASGLARLRAAAESGELDALCARHRVRVLTVFGSGATAEPTARDLDVGVLVEPGTRIDYPAIIGDLMELTGSNLDLVQLNSSGPLIRERALVGAIALYESEAGAWSCAATAAALERMDTDWMRRLGLELMAGRRCGATVRPRRLDERTVAAKLHLMETLLRRLVRFGDIDRRTIEDDLDQRLILERILTQLVDLAVAVNTQIASAELGAAPEDYRASFGALVEVGVIDHDLATRLAPSTGLRNVLVHAYIDLDMDRFVSSVPLARDQFAAYVEQVAGWLLDRGHAEG